MPTRKFPGDFSSLAQIAEFVILHAQNAGLNEKEVYSVQLAVDEACSNIIEHAYGGEGRGEISVICEVIPDGLEIIIQDQGEVFSPDSIPEPDFTVPLEQLGSRGAGMFLMKKLMDEVDFEFKKDRGTTLRMVKKRNG